MDPSATTDAYLPDDTELLAPPLTAQDLLTRRTGRQAEEGMWRRVQQPGRCPRGCLPPACLVCR